MANEGKYPAAALVSVIIPAYNAQRFIERTLVSVLNQSHKEIEVIVVDDGSTDDTAAIVRRIGTGDSRIRLVQQKNAGVAAARNFGIQLSHGAYVAPVDADDLWHPSKLEKQLRVFDAGGNELGLVYTLYRTIDAEDRLILTPTRTHPAGWVFMQHLGQNFIGNGSSLLIRRDVLVERGGYSSRLRNSGAEGSEDFFLQLGIASKYRFGVVREHLVGYRRTPGNMSRDYVRMLISKQLALGSFVPICSEAVRPILLDVMLRNDIEIARLGLKTKRFAAVGRNTANLFWRSPARFAKLVDTFVSIALRKTKERFRTMDNDDGPGTEIARNFWTYKVDEFVFVHIGVNQEHRTLLESLATMDSDLGPGKAYLTAPPELGTLDTLIEYRNSNHLAAVET